MKNENNKFIYRGSFLDNVMFKGTKDSWIIDAPQERFNEKAEQWTSLPRHVWVYWGSGINKSTVTHQLCTRNI